MTRRRVVVLVPDDIDTDEAMRRTREAALAAFPEGTTGVLIVPATPPVLTKAQEAELAARGCLVLGGQP